MDLIKVVIPRTLYCPSFPSVFHQDKRYGEDLGINSHAIMYKETWGRISDGILHHDVPLIKRFQPDHIILIVGGNDVRRLNSPEELA